jgi:phosphoribosyl-ATP pyrophosphohydrolase/phosphoribosyl-AMP cyclohydrolase
VKAVPLMTDPEQIKVACESVRFGADGLIPAIVQDAADGTVLMVAYMNRESLALSLQTGRTWFYSRSRQCLWQKGETSGHHQYIREVLTDCDQDTLLVKVDQVGVACHEGYRSCFFRQLTLAGKETAEESLAVGQPAGCPLAGAVPAGDILDLLFAVIRDRQRTLPENSYTAHLFRKGIDCIAQKVGEEAVEVVIAGKNRDRDEIINESADLVYHLLVLLAECDVSLDEIRTKLAERRQ